jgi:hypothetical protein
MDMKDTNNQKWELEYCNEDHGHDHGKWGLWSIQDQK